MGSIFAYSHTFLFIHTQFSYILHELEWEWHLPFIISHTHNRVCVWSKVNNQAIMIQKMVNTKKPPSPFLSFNTEDIVYIWNPSIIDTFWMYLHINIINYVFHSIFCELKLGFHGTLQKNSILATKRFVAKRRFFIAKCFWRRHNFVTLGSS